MKKFKETFPRGLIVSCQARKDEPMHGSDIMARMAVAAQQGGAVGIRANTPEDVRAIKKVVSLPVIGIYKIDSEESEVYITPTFEAAKAIAEAGSDMIALDGTTRARPGGETLEFIIHLIHEELQLPVMADCSTLEEGINAARAGADVVATTLSGYTPYSRKTEGPDFELLDAMIDKVDVPVIGEGRFHYPEQAAKGLKKGAWAIVAGGAITRPQQITERFVKSMKSFID